MSEPTPGIDSARRVGLWSAAGLGAVGVLYAIVVAAGVSAVGLDDPIVDPILAVMEVLTLLSAPLIVILFAAIHCYAPKNRKVFSLTALAFGILMAGLTSGVHFVELTAGRQTGPAILSWPSPEYALELLAWDVFLGFALVFATPVFPGRGRQAAARWALGVTGGLCLVGIVGPLTGRMALQRIGILGYGVGLPITSFILVAVFREPLITSRAAASDQKR